MENTEKTRPETVEVFWGEIAPSEHFVQFYDNQGAFLDTLEGYIGGGLQAGDSAIVISTPAHLKALENRLSARGVDVAAVRARDQYIACNAEETLSRFMVGGWPDEERFNTVVSELLCRARQSGGRVRAFGEMVAVLWARGDCGATVLLERLWHKLCQAEGFSLFCAYPRTGITQDNADSIKEVCAAHSRVFGAYTES